MFKGHLAEFPHKARRQTYMLDMIYTSDSLEEFTRHHQTLEMGDNR